MSYVVIREYEAMPTYRTILGQVVATTKEDLQGERLSRGELESLVASYPNRLPLHQRHDLSLETVGYIENYRVAEDPDEPGEFHIIADVSIEEGKAAPDLRGFSISFTAEIAKNSDSPRYFVYLPYPLYNDEKLVEHLLSLESDVFVGKFVKKQLDPVSIGLIGTGLALALSPEWEIQYRDRVRPLLIKLVSWISKLRDKGASADLGQYLIGNNGEKIQLIFIPDRGKEEECFDASVIRDGIEAAKELVESDKKGAVIRINRIKLLWSPRSSGYVILHVEYSDGTDCHHV